MGKPTFQGGNKIYHRTDKMKEKMSDIKEETLGQGRAQFQFGDLVTKLGSSEKHVINKISNSRA